MNVGLVGGAELAGWLAGWLIYSVSLGLQTLGFGTYSPDVI